LTKEGPKRERRNEESVFECLGCSNADGTQYGTVSGGLLPPSLLPSSLLLRATATAASTSLLLLLRLVVVSLICRRLGDWRLRLSDQVS
jgi:hypothetical protein